MAKGALLMRCVAEESTEKELMGKSEPRLSVLSDA